MTSDPNSPPTGQEGSGSTESEQIDTGVSRRHFLAALAALGLLPTAVGTSGARLNDDRVDVSHGEHGSHLAHIESGSPLDGSLELGEFHGENSEISVSATHFDDQESSNVEVKASVGPARVFLSCSPERARELADELQTAADFAEEGGY